MIGKVIEEISDAVARQFADEITAAGAAWERDETQANRDLYVARRFVRAILRKAFGAIGLK